MKTGLSILLSTGLVALVASRAHAVAYGPTPPDAKPADRFDRWDANDDGVIDKDEFKAMKKALKDRVGKRRGPDRHGDGEAKRDDRGIARAAPDERPMRGRGALRGMRRDMRRHGMRIRQIVREELRRIHDEFHGADGRSGDAERCCAGCTCDQRERGPRMGRSGPHGFGAPHHERVGPPQDGPHGRRHGMHPRRGDGGNREGRMHHRHEMRRGDSRDGEFGPRDRRGPQDGDPRGRRGEMRRRIGERLFDRFDRDDDGALSRDEFPGRSRRFERLDENDDGRLEKEEIRRHVRRFRDRSEDRPSPDGEDRDGPSDDRRPMGGEPRKTRAM